MSAPDPHRDDELACRELVELVTDYLEGALPPSERERFEAHLNECPFCIEYLEQMRTVSGSLGSLPTPALPPERREELLGAFRDLRKH
jgi:anti-sigma factor RsiW